jgi:hypothetical protein
MGRFQETRLVFDQRQVALKIPRDKSRSKKTAPNQSGN